MTSEFTLDTAEEGSSLTIIDIRSKGRARLRMLQLGITPGTHIEVLRLAPLADPVEIAVRGTKLALRRDEAKDIIVIKADSK